MILFIGMFLGPLPLLPGSAPGNLSLIPLGLRFFVAAASPWVFGGGVLTDAAVGLEGRKRRRKVAPGYSVINPMMPQEELDRFPQSRLAAIDRVIEFDCLPAI
jgi:hypothetical protein